MMQTASIFRNDCDQAFFGPAGRKPGIGFLPVLLAVCFATLLSGCEYIPWLQGEGDNDSLVDLADSSAPAGVSSFTAAPGDGFIDLNWSNPSSADLKGVKILRRDDGVFPNSPTDPEAVEVYDEQGETVRDRGLINGVNYYYAAFSHDGVPNFAKGQQAQASPVGITTSVVTPPGSLPGADSIPPAPVVNFSAVGGDGEMALRWENPTEPGIEGIVLRRKEDGTFPTNANDGDFVYKAAPGELTYLDTGLVNSTTYFYSAFSMDGTPNYSVPTTASDVAHISFTMQVKKILAIDARKGHEFGLSTAIDGSYAIVGAFREDTGGTNSGAAYIYRRTRVNSWDSGSKIVSPDFEAGDFFGHSVGIDGDYVIVGAPLKGSKQGAAYIFERTGTNSWNPGVKLQAPDGEPGDFFGHSVAISGEYAIVGAFQEDANGNNSGAVYVFQRTGTNTWDNGTKLVAFDGEPGDSFGISVAMDGQFAIVGANFEDARGLDAGAAYIFRRTGANFWDSGTKLLAPDAESNDLFGISTSISGDYAIVGAKFKNTGGVNSGASYVFRHTGGENSWDPGIKLSAPIPEDFANFGQSVAISGDNAIVGAAGSDSAGRNTGSIYMYHRSSQGAWTLLSEVQSNDVQVDDGFGRSVAISGPYSIIGANFEDDGGQNAGAAYIFR